MALTLKVIPGSFAICQFPPQTELPEGVLHLPFWSATRTSQELSLVLPEGHIPLGCRAEHGWRALEVAGPLDFNLTGILASIAQPLAAAGISIFALSTYNTDYILLRTTVFQTACLALTENGFIIEEEA